MEFEKENGEKLKFKKNVGEQLKFKEKVNEKLKFKKEVDEKLVAFLRKIDMEFLLPRFMACNIDFHCLSYLEPEDLPSIIPQINHLAEFRAKLLNWRSEDKKSLEKDKSGAALRIKIENKRLEEAALKIKTENKRLAEAALKIKIENKRTDDSENFSDDNIDDFRKMKIRKEFKVKRDHENSYETSNFRTSNENRKYAQKYSSPSLAASDYLSYYMRDQRNSTHFGKESTKNLVQSTKNLYPRYERDNSFYNEHSNPAANQQYSNTYEFVPPDFSEDSDGEPNRYEHFEHGKGNKIVEADEIAETESLPEVISDKDDKNLLPNGAVLLDEELKPSSSAVEEFLNLENIITSSTKGRSIINISRRFPDLTTKQRDDLITLIMEYLKYKNIKLVVRDFHFIVKQIVHIFPNERGHSHYYFKEIGLGRSPAGRLYSLYKKWATVHLNFSEAEAEPEPLKITDIKPVIIPTDENLMDFWEESSYERFDDIKNLPTEFVLAKWPQYLQPNGYQLFQNDFEIIYKRTPNLLTMKFDKFKKNIHDLYKNTLTDRIALSIFCLLERAATQDSENFIYVLLLNAILPATIRRVLMPDKMYKRLSFDMNDVIDCFLPLIAAPDLLEQRYEEIATKMSNKSAYELTNTPTMFAVADNYCRVYEYLVRFNSAVYKMPDVLSCIELCFQMHLVLNMPYPSIFDHLWTFIQHYFYDIHFVNDSVSSGANFVMNYLKKKNARECSNYR